MAKYSQFAQRGLNFKLASYHEILKAVGPNYYKDKNGQTLTNTALDKIHSNNVHQFLPLIEYTLLKDEDILVVFNTIKLYVVKDNTVPNKVHKVKQVTTNIEAQTIISNI